MEIFLHKKIIFKLNYYIKYKNKMKDITKVLLF
jgi:hypothetical protein